MAVYEWRRVESFGDAISARRSCAAALLPGQQCGVDGDVILFLGGLTAVRDRGGSADAEGSAAALEVIRGGSDFRWHRLPELPQGLRRHDASLAFAAGKGAADGAAYYFGGARGTVFYDDLYRVSVDLTLTTGRGPTAGSAEDRPSVDRPLTTGGW